MAVRRTRLVFHPEVIDDLAGIVAYYAQQDPSLPSRFRSRFREQIERLGEYPAVGAVLFADYRRVVIKRFPYVIVYRATAHAVSVLAVMPYRRDPSWIRRVVAGRGE